MVLLVPPPSITLLVLAWGSQLHLEGVTRLAGGLGWACHRGGPPSPSRLGAGTHRGRAFSAQGSYQRVPRGLASAGVRLLPEPCRSFSGVHHFPGVTVSGRRTCSWPVHFTLERFHLLSFAKFWAEKKCVTRLFILLEFREISFLLFSPSSLFPG